MLMCVNVCSASFIGTADISATDDLVELERLGVAQIPAVKAFFKSKNSEDNLSGRYIFKYGKTTGLTVGKYAQGKTSYCYNNTITVNNVNFFIPIESQSGKSQVLCAGGDSGGPVWMIDDNDIYASNPKRVLIGTISGVASQIQEVYYQSIIDAINKGFTPYNLTEWEYE